MSYFLGSRRHWQDCQFKQDERASRIQDVIESDHFYTTGLSFDEDETRIFTTPLNHLVRFVQTGDCDPKDILNLYIKLALNAHTKTNCLTEIMISEALQWIDSGSVDRKGPLAGIPVSLKDTISVGGFDTTAGYSSFVGNANPLGEDGAMVCMLKDMGAVPYVKTNVPISLLSFESTNDVWGRCTNPHNEKYSPGGSTGGEAALLALGGSRIGIGSDVAGSVRVPAHFSGCYSLRCSTGRWPKLGVCTSMPGQEGVPAVYSPMARTMEDLVYFTKSVVEWGPWQYDPSVHPLDWRDWMERGTRSKIRVGVMRTDGVVDPSPACVRALKMVEDALREDKNEVVEVINPPSPYEGLVLGAKLLNADGCQMYRSYMRPSEREDAGARQMSWMMDLPRPLKYLYFLWVKYVRRDDIWAGLIRDWHPISAYENWKLVAQREAYRQKWFEWWNEAGIDVLITPPNATPAVPHEGMKDAVSSCGYSFLFNLLDYTSGVLPITHVDATLDQLPADFQLNKLNGVAQGAYKLYDADAMHGLPVGVQVVGRRLEEEKVLGIMTKVEDILGSKRYVLLDPSV